MRRIFQHSMIRETAHSIQLQKEGIFMHQELCIIIHGFAGNPREIEPLANALGHVGYEIMTPLLPGHSINKERMEKIECARLDPND